MKSRKASHYKGVNRPVYTWFCVNKYSFKLDMRLTKHTELSFRSSQSDIGHEKTDACKFHFCS